MRALKDVTKVRWQVIDGSIYTEEKFHVLLEHRKDIEAYGAVAFNVGYKVGRRIVELHNATLEGA